MPKLCFEVKDTTFCNFWKAVVMNIKMIMIPLRILWRVEAITCLEFSVNLTVAFVKGDFLPKISTFGQKIDFRRTANSFWLILMNHRLPLFTTQNIGGHALILFFRILLLTTYLMTHQKVQDHPTQMSNLKLTKFLTKLP